MARSKKVSKEALKSIIADGLRNSAGFYGGELMRCREKALEYYLGYPMGTEVEGRSRVISSDVFDTIESMLPSLLKPFTSSTEVVEFDQVGPEDEAAADQVTQYCNHNFLKDNGGIKLMHEAFKDVLLSGFGCFKVFWEEKENVTTETYEGLTDDEMVLLLADPEVEAVEHEVDAADGLGLAVAANVTPASTHSLEIRHTNNDGKVVVETIAPEDILLSVVLRQSRHNIKEIVSDYTQHYLILLRQCTGRKRVMTV